MKTSAPRSEHPKPQFMRGDWVSLNGEWTYRTENRPSFHLDSNARDANVTSSGFDDKITVPFAPESTLSGIGDKEFITSMWYHRAIEIPADWADRSVLLHFGAVFYRAEVYIDGEYVGQHVGGSVSFSIDITSCVQAGGCHDLVVQVSSNLWDGTQPSGKQAVKYDHYGCFYTRTTGIWQTVWMESVDPHGLSDIQIVPDADNGRFVLTPRFRGIARGQTWEAVFSLNGARRGSVSAPAADGVPAVVPVDDPQLWELDDPVLYDLELRIVDADGSEIDAVHSYAGLRKVHIEGNRFFLNNKPVYQRLVLDQGFYPDGIWTAPSDDALRRDIELSKAAGFNGARLHQKVFEERFYYWADKLGYLCWGESSSWGLNYCSDGMPHRNFLAEWREIIMRDRNHPSIVAWTPFNETRNWDDPKAHQRVHEDAYHICKSIDPTRPVNDSSGYIHHITDIYTVHSYVQDPAKLSEQMSDQPERGVYRNHPTMDSQYAGQPYYVDEFGGIKWNPATQSDADSSTGQNTSSWGYGKAPTSVEEFYLRLEGQVKALVDHSHIAGWCYTQLTDVEQEQNGIYFYDRTSKFDMDRIRRIFQMERTL
jgi:beta-galactosidase/beta-glucuronidase